MTDELAALLDHLKVGPVNVLGWSDGAIEALLLGMGATKTGTRKPVDAGLYPQMTQSTQMRRQRAGKSRSLFCDICVICG